MCGGDGGDPNHLHAEHALKVHGVLTQGAAPSFGLGYKVSGAFGMRVSVTTRVRVRKRFGLTCRARLRVRARVNVGERVRVRIEVRGKA